MAKIDTCKTCGQIVMVYKNEYHHMTIIDNMKCLALRQENNNEFVDGIDNVDNGDNVVVGCDR